MLTKHHEIRPSKHSSWWRRVQDFLKMSSPSSSEDVLIKTNIFLLVIRLQDVFKTYSTRFWEVLGTKLSKERFDFVTHLKNLWLGYKISKGELSGYTEFFKAAFSKNFMKWLLLQTKILLSKSGIRKDVAVSVNKEKRLHTKFSTGLKKGCWILATVLKYWAHCCYQPTNYAEKREVGREVWRQVWREAWRKVFYSLVLNTCSFIKKKLQHRRFPRTALLI